MTMIPSYRLAPSSIVALCLGLAACGGGGGSGGSDAGPVISDLPDVPDFPDPSPGDPDPRTGGGNREPVFGGGRSPAPEPIVGLPSDYDQGYGPRLVKADVAYEQGARGRGVTIAVIDTGIDVDQPEFAGRISPASTDVITGDAATLDDTDGHGTHVAGIAAAAADGEGTVGIAPEATILALRTDTNDTDFCDPENGICGFLDQDVSTALDIATAQGASVINLSLGREVPVLGAFRDSLRRATAADILVVTAAGNGGQASLGYPAALAGDPAFQGLIIAVGAVDRNKQQSDISDRPETMQQAAYYLVAPGVNVESTFADGGYVRLSGTSMAAPHVAGAAAALKSAFPSLRMAEVAEILLTTAEDLGAPGTDLVYGRGLVDLETALQPLGELGVPASADVAGARRSLASSALSTSRPFGAALGDAPALGEVMALDAYARPYAVDLRGRVSAARVANPLESLIGSDGGRYALAPRDGTGVTLDLAPVPSPAPGSAPAALRGEPAGDGLRRIALRQAFGGGLSFTVGAGTGLAGLGATAAPNGGLFLDADALTRPFDAGLDHGQGLGFAANVGARTTLSAGFVAADGAGPLADAAGKGRAAGLAVTHAANDRLSLRAGLRWLGEEDALLGSRGAGAFALNGGDTRAFETGLTYGFAPAWTLDATAGLGDGGAAGDGVVRRFDDVRTVGWSLGLTRTGVFDAADRFGLLIGQPLRAFAGTAEFDVPVGRDLEGNVLRRQSKVGLEPDGRELRLQFAYARALDDATRLGAFVLYRHEPGHDADAAGDLGVGVRFSRRF